MSLVGGRGRDAAVWRATGVGGYVVPAPASCTLGRGRYPSCDGWPTPNSPGGGWREGVLPRGTVAYCASGLPDWLQGLPVTVLANYGGPEPPVKEKGGESACLQVRDRPTALGS